MLRLRYGRFVVLVGLLLLLALAVQPRLAPAVGKDILEDYLNEQRQAIENMKQFEQDIAASFARKSEFDKEIAALDAQIVVLEQQITAANNAIDALNAQIGEAEEAIIDATARLNERQAYLESRLLDIYINGDITMMDVFFSAASFDEYIVLTDMVKRIMDQDKELLDAIAAERALIEEKKAELEKARNDERIILSDLQANKDELAEAQSAKAKASREESMTIAKLQAKYEAEEAASKAVEEKIKEELAKRVKVAYFGGQFIWPLPANQTNITSEYGMRFHPILKRDIMHTGIDIGAPSGTDIYAVGAGEVIFRGWLGGYGQAVMIDHGGGVVTLYAHMSSFSAYKEGDMVVASNVIGKVGSTGQSTGPHLHFEVRENGNHVAPSKYLGK
ncbi:MAG: peptidoglycan DD-metalloendopeptidase family protein [Clostridiales bacterium]|nr:peptidoglycan DD-metalloendopeptidase family protein [Clostridiales bacterium]